MELSFSRSFVSESKASSKTQLQPQILFVPLLSLRHETPRFARGATQLLVRSLDWWCGLHVSRALGRIGTKMQTSVRAQIDYCFARGAELKEHVSHLGSFLAQICFDHSISEPSGVSFQPFCLLPVSGVIMLLLATSWFKPRKIEIKPRSPCAGDKFASLLAHVTRTKSQGCQFPCWNCSGPLSFGLVHWFCPSNTNLPLLHGCASGSNFSGWKRTCLGLHMLKVWQ